MPDRAAIEALLRAEHGDPFAVLGLHACGEMWELRVLLPSATSVHLILPNETSADFGVPRNTPDSSFPRGRESSKVKTLDSRLRGNDGLFELPFELSSPTDLPAGCGWFVGRWPMRLLGDARFDYRLRVQWANGHVGEYADAYAFGPQLSDDAIWSLAQGEHPQPHHLLGAHPLRIGAVDGVRFAVWAPNARRVSVVGSFNDWDGRRHPMRLRHTAGVWELFVPHVRVGDFYKFELLDAHGHLLPLKADPYARASELRPGTASRVSADIALQRLPAERAPANARHAAISIYEVHAGSWRRGEEGGFYDWDRLAAELPDYVAELGFTHIELMPISEHPFDGSWGYQTLGLFAPTARHGDVEGFARFVDACHARGLGLLLDWVPAHFPTDAHGLAQFDGTALYEYADPREGFHQDWNTLIYNFGRTEVREFLIASALSWLRRGVDGLRVDAVASMLYRDYSREHGAWIPNAFGGRENLEAIALFKRLNERVGSEFPGAITVAEESTAFPGVSAPTFAGGLGFHFKWNMGWMNDTLRYMQQDPIHRRWHHDRLTFGLVYAFSENFILPISHDEVVHGKGSMLGKMPGDDWQRFANLRLYYGFMWGHPGKKLLFMGQEFAQREEWHHDHALPWDCLQDARHAGVQSLIRDLNRLYRQTHALHRLDCEAQGFEWIASHEADSSVLAWLRRDADGGMALLVCNFTPVPRHHYRLGVPDGAASWREALNTDAPCYGGSGMGNASRALPVESHGAHGRDRSILLDLPPLACLVLLPA
ncbi:MAG: 1,4-alpha-glucan branching protein GlgB [Lysobacteraceae bacterium]